MSDDIQHELDPWADLGGRLEKAVTTLCAQRDENRDQKVKMRLEGKVQGVKLALSYMREYDIPDMLPEAKMLKLSAIGLSACTKMLAGDNMFPVGFALSACGHGHPFAMLDNGHVVVTDQAALDCMVEKGLLNEAGEVVQDGAHGG